MRSSRHLDFGDAYTAAAVLEEMEPTVYSYDHDFDRIDGITRLEP
jgi:predicted nucleic acid-binding protein